MSGPSERLAEEEGIQPSVALADSRQFSGLVTFATRPLLLKEFGAPPRGVSAQALRRVAPRGDSNTQWRVWNPLASPSATGAHGGCAHVVAPPEHWWAVKDSNLGDSNGIPGLQPGAFGLSANCPSELSKDLAEGRRLERLCPEGPWLSKPVGYQLPEPSGYKLQIGFRGKLQA